MQQGTKKEQPAFKFILAPEVLLVCFGLSALKCSLMFCYISTDFEVHRNWKSITQHLPLSDWYFDETSQWTLDYPPFFAYFEWFLGCIAERIDPAILTLQSEPFMSTNTLLFQRSSVIICDIVFYIGCLVLSENAIESLNGLSSRLKERMKMSLFCFLSLNVSLILLDNIHFQYNSMMYGILCCSVGLILKERLLYGALLFSILLNFKHIYLYYVPAFIGFYITNYLLPINYSIILRGVYLATAVISPLIISFAPFVYSGGLECLQQIIGRLFPFKRGLTHSYWAPNFWTLYNSLDYVLYMGLRRLRIYKNGLLPPKYTSGVVQIYDHVVLPNITPLTTHLMVLLALILLFSTRKGSNKFLKSMILSSFVFFLLSWHTHEKALLLIYIPFTVLVFRDLRFIRTYMLLSMCTIVAQLPLIYEVPVENLVKYSLAVFYITLQLATFNVTFGLTFKYTMPFTNRIFLALFVLLEIYKSFLHQMVFGNKADFLPLMLTSLLCSIGVHLVFLKFLYELFRQSVNLKLSKRACLQIESTIKSNSINNSTNTSIKTSDIKFIAGLDISAYNNSFLSVVSCTVCTVCSNELKVVYSKDEVCLLSADYLPDFLSLRELEPLAEIIREVSKDLQIDLLLVDANGTFHQRGCGLASQIGYLTGITSIGVAKNFGNSGLKYFGINDEKSAEIENMIKEECKKCDTMYDTFLELKYDNNPFLMIYRSAESTNPLYLSPGIGVDWSQIVEIAQSVMIGSSCYPIRLSDRRSRVLCKRLFEESCQQLE